MDTIAAQAPTRWGRLGRRLEPGSLSLWALTGGLVLYLAIDGGGYDVVVHSQVAIVVWWAVLVGAAWGLLPSARLSRAGWGALGLFGGFVAWTALASTWSISSERSLASLSLVAGYLGVLVLGLGLAPDRERAMRHTVAAAAAAIVVVAMVALASRLRPDLFTAAQQTATYLPGSQSRISWPLNYWNALGALMALGVPLLLGVATTARTLRAQAAAAASIPLVALCAYLTFSRGGAVASAVALVAFYALAADRIPKLATGLVAGAGSAALIAGAAHRSALSHGLTNATERHQGTELFIAALFVCAGVAVLQAGIGLAVRHGTPPRLLVISKPRTRVLLGVGIVVLIAVALATHVPSRLSHDWHTFKANGGESVTGGSISRFGVVSGEGRYQYWKAAVDATGGHVLGGSGPGTYQLLWLPRAPFYSYVENAHSLYFETLAEEGVVGLALLLGFFVLVFVTAIRQVVRGEDGERTRAAAVTAALLAFMVSAAFDWIWQVPALPAVMLLLSAAALAPNVRRGEADPAAKRQGLAVRAGAIVIAVACLVAIAVPLAETTAIRRSQAAATAGDPALALADARQAARIEPGAATPEIQLALVLELQGDPRAGVVAARHATVDEPENWSAWLVLSRLEAEAGDASGSVTAYVRARSLNPQSPLFKT